MDVQRPQLPSYPVHLQKPSYYYSGCSWKLVGPRRRNKMNAGGLASDGREFKNPDEMWREEVGDQSKKSEWYNKGVGYWQGVEATVDGVLGGYGHVNDADIKASEAFLNTLLAERFPDAGRGRHLIALDCGSGIGRVTKNLLIRYFNEVDLLEPVAHFLEAARENLAPENLMVSDSYKTANFYCLPLQDFTPDAQRYDCIWIQWCIGHLADDDLVSFFKRAKGGLKPGGFFVLKENIARSGFVLDKEDKSVTRSDLYFKELFKQCGLHIWKMKVPYDVLCDDGTTATTSKPLSHYLGLTLEENMEGEVFGLLTPLICATMLIDIFGPELLNNSLKDQIGFPDELFAVKMYALATEMPKRVNASRMRRQNNRPGLIK